MKLTEKKQKEYEIKKIQAQYLILEDQLEGIADQVKKLKEQKRSLQAKLDECCCCCCDCGCHEESTKYERIVRSYLPGLETVYKGNVNSDIDFVDIMVNHHLVPPLSDCRCLKNELDSGWEDRVWESVYGKISAWLKHRDSKKKGSVNGSWGWQNLEVYLAHQLKDCKKLI